MDIPDGWSLSDDGKALERSFRFKDFSEAFGLLARVAMHDGGDHFILVGEVKKATFEPGLDPLLYFRGSYRRLHFD